MSLRSLARIGVAAALLLLTVTIVTAQDALPAPDALEGRGAFEPPTPFYVPPEYQSHARADFVVIETTADEDDGFCGGGAGVSLREALVYCVQGTAMTVYVNPGTYILNSNIGVANFTALTLIGASPASTVIKAAGPVGAGVSSLLVVNISDTPLALMNLTFENGNVPATDGGAIFINGFGQVDIFNSVFQGNTARAGGAISLGASSVGSIMASVKYTTFENNHAGNWGGALRFISAEINGNSLLVSNSLFTGNTAAGTDCDAGGGAIDMTMDGGFGNALTIENTTFSDNETACGNGGAVYARHLDGAMAVTINDSTFTNNGAAGSLKGGGAVFVDNPLGVVDINNSTFLGNSAPFGGAVDVDVAHRVAIGFSTFDGNTASASGGAIYLQTQTSVAITDSWIINNDAGNGGGATLIANPVLISGSVITNNDASGVAGGLYLGAPGGIIQSTVLVDNTAADDGPDCVVEAGSTLSSLGGNWITDTTDCPYDRQTGDQFDNLLVNGGFETEGTKASLPDGWTVKNSTGDKRVCNKPGKPVAGIGSCAFVFTGGTGAKPSLTQVIAPDSPRRETQVGDDMLLSAIGRGGSASKVQLKLTISYTSLPKSTTKLTFSGSTGDNYLYKVADLLNLDSLDVEKATLKITDKSPSGKFYLDLVFLTVQPDTGPRADARSSGVLPPPAAPGGFRSGN